jgi:acetylornithine deacetylase
VYPRDCELILERRTLPGETSESVLRDFQEVLEEIGREVDRFDATLRPGLFRPGTEVGRDTPLVQTLLEAMAAQGLPETVEGMTAWVDAAFLNEAGVPAVCFGPGSIAQAHASEEWVPVEELYAGASVLTRFAEAFTMGGQPSWLPLS